MKIFPPIIVLWSSFLLLTCTCTNTPRKSTAADWNTAPQISNAKRNIPQHLPRMTDPRDGETYAIVTIGNQTWMAENLRYNAPGSWWNPNNPSIQYGRLYHGILAQTVCPTGWHLPSDLEWSELEMALGMPASDAHKTGWRGTHGTKMKSKTGWLEDGNGTNGSGLNVFPAGYYDFGQFEGGTEATAGFWSAPADTSNHAWVRFLAAPLKGVNRFYDEYEHQLKWGLACRCIKDE